MRPTRWVVALLVAIFADTAWSHLYSTVIPQRAGVTYLNPKYVKSGNIYVNRFGRKGIYYFNIVANINYCFANNITAHLVFYEYLHNEYKRSFVEMHFKLCDLVNKDKLIGPALVRAGVVCPIPKGHLSISNMSIPADNFPNVWPFENNKVEVTLEQTPSRDSVAQFHMILLVKQKVVKPRS